MATTFRIMPEGDFDVATYKDKEGSTFYMLIIPEGPTGNQIEMIFGRAGMVAFADWAGMIADRILNDPQG